LPLVGFDANLEATEATVGARAGKAPALLTRRYTHENEAIAEYLEPGRVVLLNTAIEAYEPLHFARTAEPVAKIVRELLGQSGIQPQATVRQNGTPVSDCEVVRFRDGDLQYLAIVRDNHIPGLQAEEVVIDVPEAAHVYDIRRQTLVGADRRISTTLTPGEPQIYALLPYAVAGVTVRAAADPVHPGDVAEFDVRLDLGGRQPAGKHVVRIEVMTPLGEPIDDYAQNLLTNATSTRVSVPLALNDLSGTWTLRATDVASGRSTTVPFTVVKR
jgi:hypothetical protein